MDERKFIQGLIGIGIVSYREQETLLDITRRCAMTAGLSMGAGLGVAGAGAGSVTIPGIGTVSGAAIGFLAGLASGTAMCVGLNLSVRDELKRLANQQ